MSAGDSPILGNVFPNYARNTFGNAFPNYCKFISSIKREYKEKIYYRNIMQLTESKGEEPYDLFQNFLISKTGGFRDVMFDSEYKSTDSGATIGFDPGEEEKYCFKNLKKIEITFDGDRKIDLQRVLRAMLDDIDRF